MKNIFILFLVSILQVLRSQNFISPQIVTTLSSELNENSGLLNLEGEIWTHTDNGGQDELYHIDIEHGNIVRTVKVHDANNVDWEDIACNEDFVFIGDFGNNDGSRTNLRIYRISSEQLAFSNDVDAEKIEFTYIDQFSFEPNYHNTNFDCEALICFNNRLYLFTKNWIDHQTNVYELPAEPGTFIANKTGTYDIGCLVTGAEIIPHLKTLLLVGYNENGGTYTWVFTNFTGNDFFSGERTKLIWTTLTQTEGICYTTGLEAYASTEKFAGELDPTLYRIDLSDYMALSEFMNPFRIKIWTDNKTITIESLSGVKFGGLIKVFSIGGVEVCKISLHDNNRMQIPVSFPAGLYLVQYITQAFAISEKILILR